MSSTNIPELDPVKSEPPVCDVTPILIYTPARLSFTLLLQNQVKVHVFKWDKGWGSHKEPKVQVQAEVTHIDTTQLCLLDEICEAACSFTCSFKIFFLI